MEIYNECSLSLKYEVNWKSIETEVVFTDIEIYNEC